MRPLVRYIDCAEAYLDPVSHAQILELLIRGCALIPLALAFALFRRARRRSTSPLCCFACGRIPHADTICRTQSGLGL